MLREKSNTMMNPSMVGLREEGNPRLQELNFQINLGFKRGNKMYKL